MPRKNKYSPRKIYQLWWEYLKRSRIFDEYLKWKEDYYGESGGEGEGKKKKVGKKFLSSKYLGLKLASEFYGDVFSTRFEDFWESRYGYLPSKQPSDELFSIFEIGNFLKEDLDRIGNDSKNINGREPNIEEFKKDIFNYFLHGGHDGQKTYFGIILSPFQGIKTICKQFQYGLELMVREFRKRQGKGRWPLIPTEPVRATSIEQYLLVYDLRKGWKKWREIAEIVYPRREFNNSLRVILRNEEKKAEKIIHNVEMGIFPGKY